MRIDVSSLKLSLGNERSCQLAPASELLNRSEFIAPANTVFPSEGSTAMLVAVPPNGPARVQSPEASAAKAAEAAHTTAIAMSRWHFKLLIIFERSVWRPENLI